MQVKTIHYEERATQMGQVFDDARDQRDRGLDMIGDLQQAIARGNQPTH